MKTSLIKSGKVISVINHWFPVTQKYLAIFLLLYIISRWFRSVKGRFQNLCYTNLLHTVPNLVFLCLLQYNYRLLYDFIVEMLTMLAFHWITVHFSKYTNYSWQSKIMKSIYSVAINEIFTCTDITYFLNKEIYIFISFMIFYCFDISSLSVLISSNSHKLLLQ